jgi:predicted XRE-type DNA-binding protein
MSKQDENRVFTIVRDELFEILAIPNARDELARVDLASAITREIRDRGLTKSDAAKILGISEAQVSAIMNARIDDFDVERLEEMRKAL